MKNNSQLDVFVFPPSAYSRSVLFFLEEAGIEYNENIINLRNKDNLSDEYKNINPTLRTPTIRDDRVVIGETSTILRYLSKKHNCFCSNKIEENTQDDFWLEYVIQHITPFAKELIWQRVLFPQISKATSADLEQRAFNQVTRSLKAIEDAIKSPSQRIGETLTLVDFVLAPSLNWLVQARIDLPKMTNKYYNKLISLDSWKRVEQSLQNFSMSN